jgi:hypothetical protein
MLGNKQTRQVFDETERVTKIGSVNGQHGDV